MLQKLNSGSNNETSSYVLSTTVMKAFHILEFISAHQPVQPADICRGLDLNRASVHRLLATLASAGYVERWDQGGYGLTFKLFQLASTVPLNKSLRDVAKKEMQEMERIAHENIYLNVLSEDVVIAIDEVKSSHHVILNPDVTFTYPVNACASGKLLLSSLQKEGLQEYVRKLHMRQLTDRTIVDKHLFVESVEAAAQQGYATEILEFSGDLNSVAAPIKDGKGQVIATISVSGPSMRLTEARIMVDLISPLMRSADRITKKLQENTRAAYL